MTKEYAVKLCFNPFIQVFYFYFSAMSCSVDAHDDCFNPFIQVFYFYNIWWTQNSGTVPAVLIPLRAKPFVQTFCLKNNEFYAAILLMIAEGKLPSLYTSSGVL